MDTGPYGTQRPPPEQPWHVQPGATWVPPRQGRRGTQLIWVGLLLVVFAAGSVGYYAIGNSLADGKLQTANQALQTALAHQGTLSAYIKSTAVYFTSAAVPTGSITPTIGVGEADIKQQLAMAIAAAKQVDADDADLASSQNELTQFETLTFWRKAELDRPLQRILRERRVLAPGVSFVDGYEQLLRFYTALVSLALDFQTVGADLAAGNLSGATSVDLQVQTAATQLVQLDSAPGLDREMDGWARALLKFANDLGSTLMAAKFSPYILSQDPTLRVDLARVQGEDFTQVDKDLAAYYGGRALAYQQALSAAGYV